MLVVVVVVVVVGMLRVGVVWDGKAA
jgi:hypothetical protein